MHVIQLEEDFGIENLRMRSRDVPRVGEHDVLLRMRAASINARDYLTVTGVYNPKQRLPLVPCSDGVGEVVDVGPRVRTVGRGDRVIPCFAQGWIDGPLTNAFRDVTLGGPLDGTLTEYMAVWEGGVVPVPDYFTDLEAGTLACAALTAWNAIVKQGSVQRGDVVLIEGTGGVAIFSLQFALMCGARPIIISKDDEKLEAARKLGAAETINYVREPNWHRTVKDMTDGRGADVVVDLGGSATLEQAVRAVRTSGQICLVGVLGGPVASLNLPLVVMRNVRLQGVTVGSRRDLMEMLGDMERHAVRPVIDRVFSFADAVSAFQYLASAHHFGKVCIRLDDDKAGSDEAGEK